MSKPFSAICLVAVFIPTLALFCCDKTTTEVPDDGRDVDFDVVYPMIDNDPAWSPDGSTIAYCHYGVTHVDSSSGYATICSDSSGIWFVNADGRNARLFIPRGQQPAWSPDGDSIAFRSETHQICRINIDGSGYQQLTDNAGNSYSPAWSPDGSFIAYNCCYYTASKKVYGIWVMNSRGINQYCLSPSGECADWCPDNQHLCYESGGIWRIDAEGRNPEQLLQLGGSIPRYSPDGNKIAFQYQDSEPNERPNYPHIFAMNSRGSEVKKLTTFGAASASWAPDGSRIAFTYVRWGEYCSEHSTIWIMNADGSDAHQITKSPIPKISNQQ